MYNKLLTIAVAGFVLSATCGVLLAQEWKSGIDWDEPEVVTPGKSAADPPADSIILFDGKSTEAWKNGDSFELKNDDKNGPYGIIKKTVQTKQKFGDCQLHLEFATPDKVEGKGQARGNSGVYFMGRYEVQILDSYENDTYYDGQCAAIYKQSPPAVNASRPPGEWQTYDIIFRAPRFDDEGKVLVPAALTVLHNGVLVQNHFELKGGTFFHKPPEYDKHDLRGSLALQYHGDKVKFRNIWIRDLLPAESVTTESILEAKKKAAELGPKEFLLGEGDLLTGIPGDGDLSLEEIKNWLANPEVHREIKPKLPLGLAAGEAQIKGLNENPLTHAKVELGRQLYFDPRLSADMSISCASCHHPDEGFAKQTQFGVGIGGQEGGRNSPVSYNRILSDLQFWDGRSNSLEDQAVGPIANPIEMGNTHDACVECLQAVPGYVVQFETVFGKDNFNIDSVAKAIAAFERAIVTGPTPYDYSEEMKRFNQIDPEDLADLTEDNEEFAARYNTAKKGSEEKPMSESALRGQELFFSERVNCAACHVGANLADEKYHNLGIGMNKENPDLGRYEVTKDEKDWGAFKTPTIRNVKYSAPYMHDGSLKTLMEVVEHYDKGGIPNKNLSDKIKKLNLTDQEKKDLVAFMESVTGPFPEIEHGRLPE